MGAGVGLPVGFGVCGAAVGKSVGETVGIAVVGDVVGEVVVGDLVGLLVGKSVGDVVGNNVGAIVGAGWSHALPMHCPETQSECTRHESPKFSHGGHTPPQSMSVSPTFMTLLMHEAPVGAIEGANVVGDAVGGVGANVGLVVHVHTCPRL